MTPIDKNLTKIREARDLHIKNLLPEIKKKVEKSKDPTIRYFLSDNIIEKILGDNPKKLYQINLYFFRKVISNFKPLELETYKSIPHNKNKDNYTDEEKRVNQIYCNVFDELRRIFRYDSFSKKRKGDSYDLYILSEKIDIPTCVYCNRMYTKTVIDENKEKINRPVFDHWFPKSKYPLLALSFYNLIPSCNICNSSIKGDKDFSLDDLYHPYYNHRPSSGKELKFTFNYDHKDYNNFKFKIDSLNKFTKDSADALALEEIYKAHEDEIKDLRNIRDAYSENYIESIEKHILKKHMGRDEIYRLAFGSHLDDAKHDRRPLSKMKKDILKELGIIKN